VIGGKYDKRKYYGLRLLDYFYLNDFSYIRLRFKQSIKLFTLAEVAGKFFFRPTGDIYWPTA
jgi:hypothetical protein